MTCTALSSWARDGARMDSDIDIVVRTDEVAHTDPQTWVQLLDGQVVRPEQRGRFEKSGFNSALGFWWRWVLSL